MIISLIIITCKGNYTISTWMLNGLLYVIRRVFSVFSYPLCTSEVQNWINLLFLYGLPLWFHTRNFEVWFRKTWKLGWASFLCALTRGIRVQIRGNLWLYTFLHKVRQKKLENFVFPFFLLCQTTRKMDRVNIVC